MPKLRPVEPLRSLTMAVTARSRDSCLDPFDSHMESATCTVPCMPHFDWDDTLVPVTNAHGPTDQPIRDAVLTMSMNDGPSDHAHMWFWSHLTRPKCGVSVCVGDVRVSICTCYSSDNSMFASKTYRLHSYESVWECVRVCESVCSRLTTFIFIDTLWFVLITCVCVCVYVITIQ